MIITNLPLPHLPMSNNFDLSDWIIWFIIGLFFVFLLMLVSAYFKARANVRWVQRALNGVSEDNFADKKLDIAASIRKKKTVSILWTGFEKTLIEVHKEDKKIVYKNTLDAAHFFNTSTLAKGVSDSRLTAAVPGFLTALGVLGTFLGLQQGLSGLQLGAEASTGELRNGIDVMISGAAVAFLTSIWGVFLSLIYNIIDKVFDRIKRNRISDLQLLVDAIFPRTTPEELLSSIKISSQQSRESLQMLAEKIGNKLQETMGRVRDDMTHSLETALTRIMAPAIDKLVSQSAESGSQVLGSLIGKFMESFGEQGQQHRKALNQSSDKMDKSFEVFGGSMNSFINKVEIAKEQEVKRDSALLEQINTAIVTMLSAMESRDKTQYDHDKQRSDELNKQIFYIQEGMKVVLKESNAANLQATQKLANTAEHLINDINNSVTGQLDITSKLIEQSKNLHAAFKESTDKYFDAAQAVKGASDTLLLTSENMSNYGTRFELANDTLSKSLDATIGSGEQLTQRNLDIAEQLKRLHEQLIQGYQQYGNIQTALQETVKTADMTFTNVRSHQQEYAVLLGENINDLAKQMTKLLKGFAQEAQDQTTNRLQHWNEQTTQYTTTMTNAINALAGVVDDIEGKL